MFDGYGDCDWPALPPMGALLNNVLHCDALDLLRALPDDSIDCVVTSPPYDNLRSYNGFTWDFESIARETYRVMKPGGVVVWVVGDATVNGSETLTSMRQALYFVDVCRFRMNQTMIWEKSQSPGQVHRRYEKLTEFMFVFSKGAPKTFNALMTSTKYGGTKANTGCRTKNGYRFSGKSTVHSEKVLSNVWRISSGYMKTTTDKDAYQHPAMFPEKLAERHILTWTNPGDIVLDYFGGSGTTAKMARNNGRQYITCDISAEYVEIIQKRLAIPYTPNMFENVA